jgi:hypothetical protein
VRFLLALATAALIAPASASAELAIGSRSAEEGWIVTVAFQASGLGPVDVGVGPLIPAVGVGPLIPAPANNSHPWLQHGFVITNTASRAITFADTRTVQFLPGLLVADQGCGYALRPLELACLLYLDIPSLDPGDSECRPITLWKGIPGMKPLEPGTYVFRKVLRFRFGRSAPGPHGGHRAVVKLVYRVEAGP